MLTECVFLCQSTMVVGRAVVVFAEWPIILSVSEETGRSLDAQEGLAFELRINSVIFASLLEVPP